MGIQINQELERLIRLDVQSGPYESAEQFVELAVRNFHEQEIWLVNHRDAISTAIDEGLRAAERGELIASQQVEANMKARKKEWLDRQQIA